MAACGCARYQWGRKRRGEDAGGPGPRPSSLNLDEDATAATYVAAVAGNSACRHTACAPHTFCIVAELDKLRGNYQKVTHQFQIKVSPERMQKRGAFMLDSCNSGVLLWIEICRKHV